MILILILYSVVVVNFTNSCLKLLPYTYVALTQVLFFVKFASLFFF